MLFPIEYVHLANVTDSPVFEEKEIIGVSKKAKGSIYSEAYGEFIQSTVLDGLSLTNTKDMPVCVVYVCDGFAGLLLYECTTCAPRFELEGTSHLKQCSMRCFITTHMINWYILVLRCGCQRVYATARTKNGFPYFPTTHNSKIKLQSMFENFHYFMQSNYIP